MKAITPSEARSRYWAVLLRLANDEAVPQHEFNAAVEGSGLPRPPKGTCQPDPVQRDISLVRGEVDGLRAEAELPTLRQQVAEERAAINAKGAELGLPRPLIHGDVCGNVLTRHDALRDEVAAHSKSTARLRAAEVALRFWQNTAAELASRRAGRPLHTN